MKNLEKYLINFDELKEGDIVWSVMNGNVEIISIKKDDKYPLKTVYYSFDKRGRFDHLSEYPTLFKSNPFLDLKEEPRMIEVFLSNEWESRKLIGTWDNYAIYLADGIANPQSSCNWREIQPKELTEKEEIELLKKKIEKLESLNEKF